MFQSKLSTQNVYSIHAMILQVTAVMTTVSYDDAHNGCELPLFGRQLTIIANSLVGSAAFRLYLSRAWH